MSTKNSQDVSWVLLSPRVTEKAALLGQDNIYTFMIDPRANKILVKEAIEKLYKVTPKKVTIINQKPRTRVRRGRVQHVKGSKKALVFLADNDEIEIL